MDRCHRLGQRRPVTVVRYLADHTIEDGILKVQERKAVIGKGALQKLSAEEARVERLTILKYLLRYNDPSRNEEDEDDSDDDE